MSTQKILILDYSTDRSETPAIFQWFPKDSDVTPYAISQEEPFPDNLSNERFTHIIHSGSALSINNDYPFVEKALHYIREMKDRGVAQFGICYGHQLTCRAICGPRSVGKSPKGLEAGWAEVRFTRKGRELLKLGEMETVWQSHFDEVKSVPAGSMIIATNEHTNIQAFLNWEMKILGTQFHPEFDKTTGDRFFIDDMKLLSDNNIELENILKAYPSFDTGRVFFDFFLSL